MQRISWVVTLIAVSTAAQAQTTPADTTNVPKGPVYVSHATNSVDLAAEVPCSMAKRNPDGSWTIEGTVMMSGIQMSDVSFGHGHESDVFESRCGKSK